MIKLLAFALLISTLSSFANCNPRIEDCTDRRPRVCNPRIENCHGGTGSHTCNPRIENCASMFLLSSELSPVPWKPGMKEITANDLETTDPVMAHGMALFEKFTTQKIKCGQPNDRSMLEEVIWAIPDLYIARPFIQAVANVEFNAQKKPIVRSVVNVTLDQDVTKVLSAEMSFQKDANGLGTGPEQWVEYGRRIHCEPL